MALLDDSSATTKTPQKATEKPYLEIRRVNTHRASLLIPMSKLAITAATQSLKIQKSKKKKTSSKPSNKPSSSKSKT